MVNQRVRVGKPAVSASLASGTPATAEEAGSTYAVQEGDTLGAISVAAF